MVMVLPPQSEFGRVPIQLIMPRGERAPDWRPHLRVVTHHFSGGNVNEVEIIGQGRLQLTSLVRLATPERFEAFFALLGTEQTLIMRHGATAFRGDREGEDYDGLYKAFDGVLLTAPMDDIHLRPGGIVDVVATFERDPRP